MLRPVVWFLKPLIRPASTYLHAIITSNCFARNVQVCLAVNTSELLNLNAKYLHCHKTNSQIGPIFHVQVATWALHKFNQLCIRKILIIICYRGQDFTHNGNSSTRVNWPDQKKECHNTWALSSNQYGWIGRSQLMGFVDCETKYVILTHKHPQMRCNIESYFKSVCTGQVYFCTVFLAVVGVRSV
jgi:hypothetical protein